MQFRIDFTGPIDYEFYPNYTRLRPLTNICKFSTPIKGYFGKTSHTTRQSYKLPITALVQAAKCPQLFEHFLGHEKNYTFYLNTAPVFFTIGTLFEKHAANFIEASPELKVKTFNESRSQLKIELKRILENYIIANEKSFITQLYASDFITKSLKSYDFFCETFKNVQSAMSHKASNKMEFSIGSVFLSGQIDLFILTKNNDGFILLDYKLKKFGDSIYKFKFEDMLQVLLYAYGLKTKGIKVKSVGYYYFLNQEMILEDLEALEKNGCWSYIEGLIEELTKTRIFKPKVCELCLICPIKNSCPIGKKIKSSHFKEPLKI